MITCDLCGEAKDCLQKEIEGKEYDICPECWKPLEQKLRGKGRLRKEIVFLPPPIEKDEKTRRSRSRESRPKSGVR